MYFTNQLAYLSKYKHGQGPGTTNVACFLGRGRSGSMADTAYFAYETNQGLSSFLQQESASPVHTKHNRLYP